MMSTNGANESSRRAYWTEQLELGYAMIQQLMAFPVAECGEGLVSIPDAADAAHVEVLFSETKIAGDLERLFFIREGLIDNLLAIGREMNARGWLLKIEDGFRTLEMQRSLVRKPAVFDAILAKCIWENGGEVPPVETIFRRATVLVANLPKVGTHMSGSAVDVSVFRRDEGTEVWRGGPYLEMSERTPMRSPFISAEELQNRLAITGIMEAHGFMHFPFEFWHFNQGDAGEHVLNKVATPCRYGPVDWDPQSNQVTPISDPLVPLVPAEQIQIEVANAIQRLEQQPR